MKRWIALLLCVCCVGCGLAFAPEVQAAGVTMPSFFGNDMLFQQNKPIRIWGLRTDERCAVTVTLTDPDYEPLEQAAVETDGLSWTAVFAPRAGGYNTYCICIYVDGRLFDAFENVVLGELWLTGGQSNMEYHLDSAVDGEAELQNASDPYLRVLHMPADPVGYHNAHPAAPADDVPGARWGRGDNRKDLADVTAIGYFAAKKLRAELDVPVGIVNTAVGATPIQTWLTRESIEQSEAVKTALKRNSLYYSQEEMAAAAVQFQGLTALYNVKIGPLAGLSIAGLLWCQGEANRDSPPNNDGFYTDALVALADGYSKVFGFENGDMPLLAVHIANHTYNGDPWNVAKWIEEVAAASELRPNIISVPLYDVPLTYQSPPDPAAAYPIHPNHKREPGERAAALMLGAVYGNEDCVAPTVRSYEIRGGAVYVTFDHVGEGLTTLDGAVGIHGFTVAGADKRYVPAFAAPVAPDTIRVWNDGVSDPQRVAYAFVSYAQAADLCNSYGIPAMPFRSHKQSTGLLSANEWLNCEDTTVFVDRGETASVEPTWQPWAPADADAVVTVETDDVFEGTGALRLTYAPSAADTAAAQVDFGYDLMPLGLHQFEYISVMLKNEDDRDKFMRLMVSNRGADDCWMLPAGDDPAAYSVTVPAHSGYTRYVFRIGGAAGYNTDERAGLSNVNRLVLLIEDTAGGSLLIDGMSLHMEAPAGDALSPAAWQRDVGDVNADGAVTLSDALWVLQYAVGRQRLTAAQLAVADVNADAAVDAADALLILRYVVEVIDRFPAGTAA